MSTILEDPDRRVVPRWRPWREAVLLGGAVPASAKRVPPKPTLNTLYRTKFDWEQNRTLPFAADFLGAASALGQGEIAREAAEFVLASRLHVSKLVQRLARNVLSEKASPDEILPEPASPNVN